MLALVAVAVLSADASPDASPHVLTLASSYTVLVGAAGAQTDVLTVAEAEALRAYLTAALVTAAPWHTWAKASCW